MDAAVEEKALSSACDEKIIGSNMEGKKMNPDVTDDHVNRRTKNGVTSKDDNEDRVNGVDRGPERKDDEGNLDQVERNGFSEESKITGIASESSPSPSKPKKRRRSSAFNASHSESPDATSRSGRTRRPKHDDELFLPSDTVLAKSPRKGRKSIDRVPSMETKVKSLQSSTTLNGSFKESLPTEMESAENTDLASDLKTPADSTGEANVLEQDAETEYEPGDLIWGRLGHHPFWPCIIINDPVDCIYYKKDGRGRLSYHVLFYGDNGKRSWVNSSMILRFLGLQDFELQVAAITVEVKKKDPKLFSGFFVKPATKPRWESAVREAEEVMPMTRDERLDAFLRTMPQRKGKKSKVADDDDENDTDATAEGGEGSIESEGGDSPTSSKKKKLALKSESSPPEKKKRGRPRKSEVLELDKDTPEPASKTTPGPGRPRKRKLLTDVADSRQGGHADDDIEWKAVDRKRKRRKKKEKKSTEEKAFSKFSEKYVDRIQDDHPDMNNEEVQKYLRLLWDRKDEDEKAEFIRTVALDDKSEEETASEDEENDGRDDTGIEEEVATVASADSEKETNEEEPSVVISKKKINLFRGYKMERVCQNCEKPGNTVRCRGPCAGVFHVECARGADNSVGQFLMIEESEDKPKKRGRKKKEVAVTENLPVVRKEKSSKEGRLKKIYADEETDSDLDYADGEPLPDVNDEEAVMRMILGDATEMPKVTMVTQDVSEEEEDEDDVEENAESDGGPLPLVGSGDFRCGDCAVLRTPLCFVCGQATVPSDEDSVRVRCSIAHCGKHYHMECLKVLWQQAKYTSTKGAVLSLQCPQHVCHTCVSDNPSSKGRFTHERLVRCIRCPTSYHYGNYCVPAGSEILTATQIICPRHYEPPKKGNHHINASWCFICSIGGSLICCDLCPSSFHADCLKIKPPAGGYICEDCETGRYPLYNEVLWVKLGYYRWWPALSLFPSEVPDNVKSHSHKLGEFAVRFLGTNDHYWIERGRCFVYHEGDCVGDKKATKSPMETSYQTGVLQANELHKAHKEMRSLIQSQSKAGNLKPPQYVKIKTNKAVGSVKMIEIDTSNISPCECDPHSDHPCSPDTECLNRILMVECDPNTCPAGEKCENQYFEKRIYPALAPYWTDGRGWGLKALEDLKKGSFVIEYVGEVIDDDEYQRRLLIKHQEKDENYYFLTIDSTRIIDAGPKGNVSRFMNHSCQPNCETQKWTIMGDTRVGLFTICDVPAGTELTFNYNLESKGNEKKPCMCGAPVCSGFIGAKKTKVPQVDMKEISSSGKKKRRKPRVRNLIEDICLLCDADKEVGVLIACINKKCLSKYHLPCLGLSSTPQGKWLCPRHHCNVCQKKTQHWCSYCTESYCPAHVGENLVSDPLHGHICEAHQKNPLSKDHLKTKRDEARKQKEEEKRKIDEEKRKQYEEERARRRSRREQITNDEEASKVKRSDLEDTASEGSMYGEDRTVDSIVPKTESMEETSENEKTSFKSRGDLSLEEKSTGSPKEEKRTPKPKTSPGEKNNASPLLASKRGRKKKILAAEGDSSHASERRSKYAQEDQPTRSGRDSKVTENVMEPKMTEESQISSSVMDDSCKDEIPEADPTLDKFIQAPASIEDESLLQTPEAPKKKKKSSPKSDKATPTEASPSSVTKRRRKPPVHNMDYINSQSLNLKRPYVDSTPDRPEKSEKGGIRKLIPKKSRETNFDKVHLMDELEDIATGFASGDDGQESPKIHFKKAGGKGKRPSMGSVRSHTADSTTNEVSDNSGPDKVIHRPSPKNLKSPLSPTASSPLGSPEKLSASKIFAMQRAKGLKVMPPNRRLSLAREQALGVRSGDDGGDKMERLGKGLKVMKGRRVSVETNTSERRTENLHGEVMQSGLAKKVRPVLSKVEDNGVSVEDEEDKALENSSLPLPKQPPTRPLQSPPGRKLKPPSPKKSSAIGVCSLWNQDILNIMK